MDVLSQLRTGDPALIVFTVQRITWEAGGTRTATRPISMESMQPSQMTR